MGKYYIQSGNFKTVITADDAEKAALWVFHKVMAQVFHSDAVDSGIRPRCDAGSQNGLLVLGEIISISEHGFDSPQQTELSSLDLLVHWSKLTVALAKLESMMLAPIHGESSESSESAGCSRYQGPSDPAGSVEFAQRADRDLALCALVAS